MSCHSKSASERMRVNVENVVVLYQVMRNPRRANIVSFTKGCSLGKSARLYASERLQQLYCQHYPDSIVP